MRTTSRAALAPRLRPSSRSTLSTVSTDPWFAWRRRTSRRCPSTRRRRISSCPARPRSPRRCASLPPTKGSGRARPRPPRTQVPPPHIEQAEYSLRRESVAAGMQAAGLDALCVFYPARIAYLTGFHHIPTERPIVLILGAKGSATLVVPAVEKEHAEATASKAKVDVYFEYPGAEHPMERVASELVEMGAKPK